MNLCAVYLQNCMIYHCCVFQDQKNILSIYTMFIRNKQQKMHFPVWTTLAKPKSPQNKHKMNIVRTQKYHHRKNISFRNHHVFCCLCLVNKRLGHHLSVSCSILLMLDWNFGVGCFLLPIGSMYDTFYPHLYGKCRQINRTWSISGSINYSWLNLPSINHPFSRLSRSPTPKIISYSKSYYIRAF